MFNGLQIHLAGPICTCATQNLKWNLSIAKSGKFTLTVFCGTCQAQIVVPPEKFLAKIICNTPYPKGVSRVRQETMSAKIFTFPKTPKPRS